MSFHLLVSLLKKAFRLHNANLESPLDSSGEGFLKRPVSRRQFLKHSAGLGLLLSLSAMPQEVIRAASQIPQKRKEADVVIVGAGLAGLACAYALGKAGCRTVIYEGSPRLGGRVSTRYHVGPDQQYIDLGGEFVDTEHFAIKTLCKQLGVKLTPFASDGDAPVPAKFFMNGHWRSDTEILVALKPLLACLTDDLKAIYPQGELIVPTYKEPFQAAAFDRITLSDYLNRCPDLEPWLKKLIEIAYMLEYGLDVGEQSALNFMTLFNAKTKDDFDVYGESDERYRIAGGSSMLVKRLEKAVHPFSNIYREHRLIAIRDHDTKLQLIFQGANGITKAVSTKQAVLAIPLTQARTVEGIRQLSLSPAQKQMINQLGYGTNSKLILSFPERFWKGNDKIFCDLPSQSYWEMTRHQAGDQGILTNFTGGETGKRMSAAFSRQVQRDLKTLYFEPLYFEQGPETPLFSSRLVGVMNWYHNPWSHGSYTCLKPGQYTRFFGATAEPALNGRLFFAGEHCSREYSGYMNGAVESGLNTAHSILKGVS